MFILIALLQLYFAVYVWWTVFKGPVVFIDGVTMLLRNTLDQKTAIQN